MWFAAGYVSFVIYLPNACGHNVGHAVHNIKLSLGKKEEKKNDSEKNVNVENVLISICLCYVRFANALQSIDTLGYQCENAEIHLSAKFNINARLSFTDINSIKWLHCR